MLLYHRSAENNVSSGSKSCNARQKIQLIRLIYINLQDNGQDFLLLITFETIPLITLFGE